MAKDLRHVLAGCLTASMLLMLCNMIKKDHIDPLLGDISVYSNGKEEKDVATKRYLSTVYSESSSLWGGDDNEVLIPCWRKSTNVKPRQSRGYVFITLAQDAEYHLFEIANAVVVAQHLGASLVLPNIRGSEAGEKWKFGDIYDVKKLVESLDGKVSLAMDPQDVEVSNSKKVTTVRVPNMVSKEFINSRIEPIFTRTNLRLATYFPSPEHKSKPNPYACLAMFDTLKLRPELQESIDSMVLTLRSLSSHSRGRFIAVDYRTETLLHQSSSKCHEDNATTEARNCIDDAKHIALFLQKVGFAKETTIYLTLNEWHSSVEPLREAFPNTYTKDMIILANDKPNFLDPKHPELRGITDVYISSVADVYVQTSTNVFSDNVVARRIATGKTQVLVPDKGSSDLEKDFVPTYISLKKHWAYSCFC
ncbi:hypothetical protein DM860_015462 [Cuscuta australis]|uniref:O-fucosyltransferase family protein n=1 Tax=Cuscuta australis TaxID=267555 RepID=A0A328E6V3_9ASTE|nr:hypothetical protein DM860_015462 [Cuscuta australis]